MTIGTFARSLGGTANWKRAAIRSPRGAGADITYAPWRLGHVAAALGLLLSVEIALLLGQRTDLGIPAWNVLVADEGTLPVRGFILESLLLVSLGLLVFRNRKASFKELGLRRSPGRRGLHLALALGVLCLLVVNLAVALAGTAGLAIEGNLQSDLGRSFPSVMLLGVFLLVLAPVVEELFFRGLVFGTLRQSYGLAAAALISGALFGLAHFANPGSPFLILPIAATGVILGLGYAYSGSILTTMVAHFLFNLVGFLAILS